MKLALGTVQFGIPYGTFNTAGVVPEPEVAKCLDLARREGIDMLDTARVYGNSEGVLGSLGAAHHFKIVTKVAPLNGGGGLGVKQSLKASLDALNAPSVFALLLHRAADLLDDHGADVWRAMREAKDLALVDRIGVSVYGPDEIDAVLARFPVDIVQAPFSAFDQRLRTSGMFDRLAANGVEVHVRSLFLQGFALADPSRLPAHFVPYKSALMKFREAAQSAGLSPLEFALTAAKQEQAIARAVLGVQSFKHLREVVNAASAAAPDFDFSLFSSEDQGLINPSLWAQTA